MIKSFIIEGFRKFDKIEFKDLSTINIFLGNNNAGKTTILESIFAFASGENIRPILEISIMRRKDVNNIYDIVERILDCVNNQNEKPFKFSFKAILENNNVEKFSHYIEPGPIFSDMKPNLMGSFGNNQNNFKKILNLKDGNTVKQIEQDIIANWIIKNGNKKSKVNITFPVMDGSVNGDVFKLSRFSDILSHRNQQENTKIYSFLKREGLMEDFVRELSKTFIEIEDIDIIPYPDGSMAPVSFKVKNRGFLPIYNFGDGMQRWYNILGGMTVYKNAIHCIEEIDATFHPDAQVQLGKNLIYYSKKYKNQIFATSHSLEFVDNLLKEIYEYDEKKLEEDVRIITLKNDYKTNSTKVRVMSGLEAYKSREDYDMELR